MLNPDGVIVGNYRCSLAARDLNRNYRHPRKESFPTVWFTKSMMEKILERHDVRFNLVLTRCMMWGTVNFRLSYTVTCMLYNVGNC
jgi:hypothetical protein